MRQYDPVHRDDYRERTRRENNGDTQRQTAFFKKRREELEKKKDAYINEFN